MEAEKDQDYFLVLQISRLILRLQMELMKETVEYEEDGKKRKKTLYGTETKQFQEMKTKIKALQTRLAETRSRSNDPSERYNNNKEMEALAEEIKDLSDDLMAANSRLGLNYKKNDVDESWSD